MHFSPWAFLTLGYHLASRLAYVLYIGIALGRQDQTGLFTRRYGTEGGFRRFRRVAATVMHNDAVSFILLCVATRNTLVLDLPRSLVVGLGVLLVLVGLATKLWAATTLRGGAYYWRNFFVREDPVVVAASGPYRWLRNPMYTVGYLQTYGFALATGSLFGLLAALFDQAAILLFYRWVEKPHFERSLDTGAPAAQDGSSLSRSPRP